MDQQIERETHEQPHYPRRRNWPLIITLIAAFLLAICCCATLATLVVFMPVQ